MLYIQQNQACIYAKVCIALGASVCTCVECFYKTVLCSSKCSILQVKKQHCHGKITNLKQKNKHTQNANVSLKYLQKRLKASSIQRHCEMSRGTAKYLSREWHVDLFHQVFLVSTLLLCLRKDFWTFLQRRLDSSWPCTQQITPLRAFCVFVQVRGVCDTTSFQCTFLSSLKVKLLMVKSPMFRRAIYYVHEVLFF